MTVATSKIDRQLAQVQRGQRVKVGLIGLAAVLLLIGLASAVFNAVNRERPVAAVGAARPATVAELANTTAALPPGTNEPLAEIGVAPPSAAAPADPNANLTTRTPR